MAESTILPNATPARSAAYTFSRGLVRLFLRLFFRIRWIHRERVPLTGPVLLVGNHESYIDPPAIGAGMRRHSAYLGRAGLFRNPVLGFMLRLYNVVPVGEEGGDIAAMRAVLSLLAQGHSVVIFPEGSRSEEGTIGPFKRGAEVIVRKARCPVVPVAIDGAFEAWPRSRKRPRLFGQRVRILYGLPIAAEKLLDPAADGTITERLEAHVRALHAELLAGP
jgi:1-acyl-sn-glycerol-3-phosphate acyltransferase